MSSREAFRHPPCSTPPENDDTSAQWRHSLSPAPGRQTRFKRRKSRRQIRHDSHKTGSTNHKMQWLLLPSAPSAMLRQRVNTSIFCDLPYDTARCFHPPIPPALLFTRQSLSATIHSGVAFHATSFTYLSPDSPSFNLSHSTRPCLRQSPRLSLWPLHIRKL